MQVIRCVIFGLVILLVAAVQTQAKPILDFNIIGDTYGQPFTITNNSTAGEMVTRFQLDLSPVGMVFDTVDFGPPGNNTFGTPFTPVGGTDIATGLIGPVVVPDGASLLDVSFNDFAPLEFFRWNIDVDSADGSDDGISVYGNQLIGALATIDFSDGQRLLGELQAAPNNPNGSVFTVTGITQTPGVTPTPEPGSLALFGIGALGMAFAARRRRK